jgi:hypothetical protein
LTAKSGINKNLVDVLGVLADLKHWKNPHYDIFGHMKQAVSTLTSQLKKYFSEKNALTVMVSLFCFVMMIISIVNNTSIWEAVAFALAFSFSVELICHRTRERK